jgi:hypothetical protein
MEDRMDERSAAGDGSLRPTGCGGARRLCLLTTACLALSGCGLVALPFRVAGDVVQVVPVVGKPLGEPIHGIGDAID